MRTSSRSLLALSLLRYFVVLIVVALLLPQAWSAPAFKAIYSFKGAHDGEFPAGTLVLDKSGNLFGSTLFGGTGNCTAFQGNGCGTVFELKKQANGTWKHIVIYSFAGGDDGVQPNGGMVFDVNGNLYGTTFNGGTSNTGTVFELTPGANGWTESVIYSFKGVSPDGAEPMAGLSIDHSGNLYGTTWGGGKYGGGTVFELSPGSNGWTETILYGFCPNDDCSSGLGVLAAVTLGPAGNLFGVTEFGGNGPYGTVFELTPANGSWNETTLHSFSGPDGVHPNFAQLAFDGNSFYGTTDQDGVFGYGNVFRFSPAKNGHWTQSIVYNFRSGSSEGVLNYGVAIDGNGNLFGANGFGGGAGCQDSSGCGVVYEVTPRGHRRSVYAALHAFSGAADGGQPSGAPILDQTGNLYGTAEMGGAHNFGVVYAVHP